MYVGVAQVLKTYKYTASLLHNGRSEDYGEPSADIHWSTGGYHMCLLLG